MKRKVIWLVPVLLIGLLAFSACEENNSEETGMDPDYDEDKVLVTVNGDEITQRHYDTYILQLKTIYETQHGMDLDDPSNDDVVQELKKRAMDELIRQRAVVQRSKELNFSVPESFIEQQVQGIIDQQGSESDFENFLENRQLTREELEILIKEDYLITKVYDSELNLDGVEYDDDELSALYDRFVEQRENLGREAEPFEEVEEELSESLLQRLRHEKRQDYIENLLSDSEIEYFYN